MNISNGFFKICALVLLTVGSYVNGAEPQGTSCISWQKLLGNDDQTSLLAHLNNKRPYPDNKQLVLPPEGCTIAHTLYMGRHGSRYVTKSKKITKILNEFSKLLEDEAYDRSLLTEEGRALQRSIEQLSRSVNESQTAGSITKLGQQELKSIARRLASGTMLAPARLGGSGAIVAMTSDTLRTKQSLNAFMEGLRSWSFNDSLDYITDIPEADADRLLRSYKHCPGRTEAYSSVKNQFKEGRQQLISEAAPSFGFIQSLSHKTLTSDEQLLFAGLIYNLCQIDSSYPEAEQYGFCRYFLDQSGKATADLKLLGRLQNLKQWYKRGFASKNTVMFNLAHPVLDKVIEELSRVDNPEESGSVLNLWFTHDSAMVALVMLMGYYDDQLKYELWDSDIAAPMSANVQWRVYQCNGENKLQVLLNEQPICLPACPDAFCSLSDYIAQTRQKLSMIDFQGECGGFE